MKQCTKCLQEKPANEFYRDRSRRDGLCDRCIECRRLRNKTARERRVIRHLGEKVSAHIRYKRLRSETLNAYGNRCACCGEQTPEFLSMDHVYGSGSRERRELKRRGKTFFGWIKRQGFPQDLFQILCHNCNMAKGFYGVCPHQRNKGLLFEVKRA